MGLYSKWRGRHLIIRLLFVLAGLSVVSNCSSQAVAAGPVHEITSSAEEDAYRLSVQNKVLAALRAEDFQTLNKLEEDFRTSRSRAPSGYWNLGIFHASVDYFFAEGLTKEKGCVPVNASAIARWKAASPNSPAPIISEAAMLEAQGWCYRGTGYSDTVAAEDWPKFRQGLQSAYEILEADKKIASVNPEFYATQASLYRGLSAPEDKFKALMDEAMKREPAYHRTYFNAVWHYMPQWGGSWAEVDRFLRHAAKKSEATEGSGVYIRTLWYLESCNCDIIRQVADWPTLQASMRDVYQRFPNGRNREYFMKLACKMDKPQEAFDLAKMGFPDKSKDELNTMTMQACSEAMAETQAASR